MKRLGPRMRLFVIMATFLSCSFMIFAGASLVAPRQCVGAKCDPTVNVMNVSWFGQLLQKTAYNFLVNQAKMAVLSKLNLEFLPGGFADILMGELVNVSDLSGKIESVMNGGLQNELSYIRDQMSPEALRSTLNSTVENTFRESLSTVSDLTRSQVEGLVGGYRDQFLMAQQTLATYASSAKDYQAMMSTFTNEATAFTSSISNLGTKIDIADFVKGENGLGSIVNTEAVIKEANTFIQNGIQNVVAITGYDIGVSVETNFVSMNSQYLRSTLENMVQATPAGKTALFTKEQIDEIVANSNKAASASVASYLTNTSNALTQQAVSLNSKLQGVAKNSVGQAEKVIQGAISTEKLQDSMAQALSKSVQNSVQAVTGDVRKYLAVAGETKPLSYSFSGSSADDTEKIATLLMGGNKTNNVRVIAKQWMVAKESSDAVRNIQAKLRKYNPATIDAKPEDAAWKDAARFQYYSLMLQNQQMKLLAVKAIASAVMYESKNDGLKKYIQTKGLPSGF